MKLTMKLPVLLLGVMMLADIANAESPREQLRQMVEQLQQSPNDDVLREQIIKLARQIKPAPAVPEKAERRMVRGAIALKGAKSVADYRDAAKEFEQATLAAPWYGDAYFNLGFVQDKAEDYAAALRNLKLASPSDKEIKTLIYEVEYQIEKANSPEAQAAKRKQQEQEDHLIIPGDRIGPVRMGGLVSEAVKQLGNPDKVSRSTFRGPGYDADEVRFSYSKKCIDFTWEDSGSEPKIETGLRGITVTCDK